MIMVAKRVFISGCNRGLGLGFIKALVKHSKCPEVIFAACRTPRKAEELQELAKQYKSVHIIELDVANESSQASAVKKTMEVLNGRGLNLLINNAGIGHRFTRLGLVKWKDISEAFETNVTAPIMLTKAFLPALKSASVAEADKPAGVDRAAVINLSSILGSIENNKDGGFYPYRCSKAALNMATVSMKKDLENDNIIVCSLHPGWVKTALGGPKAPVTVEDATTTIIDTLTKLTVKDSGTFIQYDGKLIEW